MHCEKDVSGTSNGTTFVTLTKSSHLNPFYVTLRPPTERRRKKFFIQTLQFSIGFHYIMETLFCSYNWNFFKKNDNNRKKTVAKDQDDCVCCAVSVLNHLWWAARVCNTQEKWWGSNTQHTTKTVQHTLLYNFKVYLANHLVAVSLEVRVIWVRHGYTKYQITLASHTSLYSITITFSMPFMCKLHLC